MSGRRYRIVPDAEELNFYIQVLAEGSACRAARETWTTLTHYGDQLKFPSVGAAKHWIDEDIKRARKAEEAQRKLEQRRSEFVKKYTIVEYP